MISQSLYSSSYICSFRWFTGLSIMTPQTDTSTRYTHGLSFCCVINFVRQTTIFRFLSRRKKPMYIVFFIRYASSHPTWQWVPPTWYSCFHRTTIDVSSRMLMIDWMMSGCNNHRRSQCCWIKDGFLLLVFLNWCWIIFSHKVIKCQSLIFIFHSVPSSQFVPFLGCLLAPSVLCHVSIWICPVSKRHHRKMSNYVLESFLIASCSCFLSCPTYMWW